MKKTTIAICAAVCAALVGVSFAAGKMSRNKAEQQQSIASEKQQQKQQQLTVTNPILTIGDTDDERNYGYDVLYRHDGITITLLASYFDGEEKDIKIAIENDTDKDIQVRTAYTAANGTLSDAYLRADIAAGETSEETISYLNEFLRSGTDIDDVELRFCFINDDDEEDYYTTPLYSKQIKIIYRKAEHTYEPRSYEELIWEAGGFELYKSKNEIEYDDNGKDALLQFFYLKNTGDTDYFLSFSYTIQCFAGNEEIPVNTHVYHEMPAGCSSYVRVPFRPDKPGDAERIDTIKFTPMLVSFENEWETLYRSDELTIEIEH